MRPYVLFPLLTVLSACGPEWEPPEVDYAVQASFLPPEYYERGVTPRMAPEEELASLWSESSLRSLDDKEAERICELLRPYLPATRGYFAELKWGIEFEESTFYVELEGEEDVPVLCQLAFGDPEFFPTDEVDGYLGTGDEVAFRLAAGRVILSIFVSSTGFAVDYPARSIARQFDLDGLAEL